MLSRVAAQLYWLSRYLERAENMARILEVGQSFALLSTSDSSRAAPDTRQSHCMDRCIQQLVSLPCAGKRHPRYRLALARHSRTVGV